MKGFLLHASRGLALLFGIGSAYAAPLSLVNNSPISLTFNSNGSIPCIDAQGNSTSCKILLSPGQTQNFSSGKEFYAAYAANTASTYYGFYVGSTSGFQAPGNLNGPYVYVVQGSTSSLQPAYIVSQVSGNTMTLSVSPSLGNFTPGVYTSVPFRGVNLSGLEAGGGGTYTTAYWNSSTPNLLDAQYFIAKGINTVRIPINWGFLTPTADTSSASSLNANQQFYLQNLNATIQSFLQNGLTVVLDLHSYMRYGTDQAAGSGSIVSASQTAAVWTLLANNLKPLAQTYNGVNKSNQLIFEIMNEPYGMDTNQVLANTNAAIAAIRNVGVNNLILVEGNAWSGLHSWMQNDNNTIMTAANIKDPANNYALAVHQYFDSNGSGTNTTCQSLASFQNYVNLPAFITWMQQNHMKVFLSEFGAPKDSNCAADIDWLLTQMEQNAYSASNPSKGGFIGWTAWVAGHSWAANDINTIMPVNGVENVNMVNAYSKHLVGATTSVGSAAVNFGTIPQGFPTSASTAINVDGVQANATCNIVQGCTLTNIPTGSHTFSANQLSVSYNNAQYIYTFSPVTATVAKNATVTIPFNLNNSQVLYPYTANVTYSLSGVTAADNPGVQVSFSGSGISSQSCTIPAGSTSATCKISYQSAQGQSIAMSASTPSISGYQLASGPSAFSVKDGVASPSALTATYNKVAPPPAGGCVVTASASAPNQYWTSSFNGKVGYMTTLQLSVQNNGSTTIPHVWTLVIKNPNYVGVQNGWNWTASSVASDGSISGSSIASWESIPAGQSVSVGLNLGASSASMASFIPTSATLNGQVCTIKQ